MQLNKHTPGHRIYNPQKPTFTKPWSSAQIANRKKFGKAARAAATIAKKLEIQEKYSNKLKPRQNVLNLIVGEKLRELEEKK